MTRGACYIIGQSKDQRSENLVRAVCPGGTDVSWSSRCFSIGAATATWNGARTQCQASGSMLAVVDSAALHTAMAAALDSDGPRGQYWIGLSDEQTEGYFRWETGEITAWTIWETSEPQGRRTENCAALDDPASGYTWHELGCTAQHYYICEYPARTVSGSKEDTNDCVTEPASTIQQVWKPCYILYKPARRYNDAVNLCASKGAMLANFTMQLYNEVIEYNSLVSPPLDYYWTNLEATPGSGLYRQDTDSCLPEIERWDSGLDYMGFGSCARADVSRDQHWRTTSCNSFSIAICDFRDATDCWGAPSVTKAAFQSYGLYPNQSKYALYKCDPGYHFPGGAVWGKKACDSCATWVDYPLACIEDFTTEATTVEMTTSWGSTTVPDTTVPDTTVPDTSVPDTTVPYTTVPDTSVLDTTVPDTTMPDTTMPDTTVPDTTMPDTTVPDTTMPDTTVPDTTVPDTTVQDTTVPDTTVPDTTMPDTTVPDTTRPDTTVPDTTVPDTTVPDTTMPDTTVPDTAMSVTTVSAPAGLLMTMPSYTSAIGSATVAGEGPDTTLVYSTPVRLTGRTEQLTEIPATSFSPRTPAHYPNYTTDDSTVSQKAFFTSGKTTSKIADKSLGPTESSPHVSWYSHGLASSPVSLETASSPVTLVLASTPVTPISAGCRPIPKWRIVATTSDTRRQHGAKVVYECEEGRTFLDKSKWKTNVCGSSGQWASAFEDCVGRPVRRAEPPTEAPRARAIGSVAILVVLLQMILFLLLDLDAYYRDFRRLCHDVRSFIDY